MYLMNVPPVAATRTEWRPCGPRAGFSLPICFDDSDVGLSTQASPVSDKVQMIIESLRGSQSSLEMGNETEGNAQSGQEGHPKICKVMGSYVEVKPKGKSTSENQLADVSSMAHHRSCQSDSDDSVDRGIEEAILEYLKEKDDHKRKAEPCGTFLQTKIPRKCPPVSEISKPSTDGNPRVISGSHFSRSVKAETAAAPPVLPTKKHLKSNYLIDKMQKKLETNKSMSNKTLVLPKQKTKCPPKAFSIFNKIKCPAAVKMADDSSSDDGIEEAIQRYQIEKTKQERKRKKFHVQRLREESDSTSDDGIEEAIRHYQLEQLKGKREGVLKSASHKPKPSTKSLIHGVEGAGVEHARRNRLRKKKSRTETETRPIRAAPSFDFTPKRSLSDRSNGNGSAATLSKEESFKARPALTSANTTAELMCAEAILDISKTVMPEAFGVGLAAAAASARPSFARNAAEDDASSVDSEDGIEQEIRKFLEQKAQMHKQPPSSAASREPPSSNDPAEVKTKPAAIHKKPSRLSLTQRRMEREESRGKLNISGTDVGSVAPKLSPEQGKELNSSQLFQKRERLAIVRAHQTEQSGDKSSSLDSDEDLDTAIKDLLQTKKKSRKKVRDLKWKSSLKDEDPNFRCASQTNKLRIDAVSKRGAFKKERKCKEPVGLSHALTKTNVPQHKAAHKTDGCDGRVEKLKVARRQEALLRHANAAPTRKDDSSSVDSDDSIEQEIRRFLAAKAKVSTTEKGKDRDVSTSTATAVCGLGTDTGPKQENQLAEVPTLSFSICSEASLLSRWPGPVPESLQPVVSGDGAQSGQASARSGSPGLLEPADRAGAARTEQRPANATQAERVRPGLSPKNTLSSSQSNKWRQCLGLPTTDSKAFNRTSFYITSPKTGGTAPATPPFPSRIVTPKSQSPNAAWSSVKTSRAPFSCSRETSVYSTFQSPVLRQFPAAARQQQQQQPPPLLTPRLAHGHHLQRRIEGEAASTVHIPKDKTVFVELESNRTNHVQVRSRNQRNDREEVAEVKREEERTAIYDKEVHQERAEDFIDEPDCEPDQRNPQKQQGYPPLSLSSAIDPGINISPCIALTTEERSNMFGRRCLANKCTQVLPSFTSVNKSVQHVKRKLQFVSVYRRNDASGLL